MLYLSFGDLARETPPGLGRLDQCYEVDMVESAICGDLAPSREHWDGTSRGK